MPQQSDAVVLVEDAYEAARVRAVKTTEALVLAEARILALVRERDTAVRELGDVRAQLETYKAAEAGEGEDDGADPVGYTKAVGQAD
jgi:hypothetical protein